MGFYGSNSISVAYDDSQGGTARTITSYVLTIGGIKIDSKMDDGTAYGATIMKQLPTGVTELMDWEMEGLWETTNTTGSHAVLKAPDTDPNGGTRTLTLGFGDSKTWATEGYLKSYEVLGQVGKLTRFRASGTQHSGGWS